MKGYELKVYPIKGEDGVEEWCAEFPAIEGIVGGGDSPEQAVKEAVSNLEDYIALLEQEQKTLPTEYNEPDCSGKLSIRMPISLHRNLKRKAEYEGISLNQLINYYLSSNLVIDIMNENFSLIQATNSIDYRLQSNWGVTV